METVNREIMAAEHSNASSELCSSPSSNHFPSEIPLIHRVSLRRQALQRKRDMRPKHQLIPKLRVRRH